MTPLTAELDAERTSFFRSVPWVNNFVYPPLRDIPADTEILMRMLKLEDDSPTNDPFVIYVSIPYCQVRCHSCHCFRQLLPRHGDKGRLLEEYLESLFDQIEAFARTPYFTGRTCGAIYIGGGTASLLSGNQARRLVQKMKNSFGMAEDLQLAFEGNPVDFTPPYLEELREIGVSRLSIGYQSANNSTLTALNSPHRSAESLRSVRDAMAAGFQTVNVDLLFNVPGQTEADWRRDVQTLVEFEPGGISPGDYIVFPDSPSDKLVSSGRLPPQQDPETVHRWYNWTCEELGRHGYGEQVRGVFARPGNPYRYVELSCMGNRELIGLGAGAYSFIGRHQFQASGTAEAYKTEVRRGQPIHAALTSTKATDGHLMGRFVILNLFSSKVDRLEFRQRFGTDLCAVFSESVAKLERLGLIEVGDVEIRLTDLGKMWRRHVYHEFRSPEFQV